MRPTTRCELAGSRIGLLDTRTFAPCRLARMGWLPPLDAVAAGSSVSHSHPQAEGNALLVGGRSWLAFRSRRPDLLPMHTDHATHRSWPPAIHCKEAIPKG